MTWGSTSAIARPADASLRLLAAAAIDALRGLVAGGRLKRLQLERLDGEAIGTSSQRERLGDLGFRQAYKGYLLDPAG